MDKTPSFTRWRERPLFFSSTFRDMHAERDRLKNDTFLILDEGLRTRHHHLNVIDLRQGLETVHIVDEAARELEVLKVCIGEVQRSRPFLIGLIGDRYGWIPPEENMRAAARAAGFEGDVASKSVTELELLYGVRADSGQQARSRIYIRDMDYTGMPDAVRAEYDERYATDAEAPTRWQKLEDLKKRLQDEFPGRVRTYAAKWDAAAGRVTGLDGLHKTALADLGADLDAETAEYAATAPKTWQEADARALDDFALDRLRHFVERPAVTDPALAHAVGQGATDNWGLCLTGESGLGKSAIFASLYRGLKQRESEGELLVLANAAGIFAGSGQIDRMLRRWVHELARFLQVQDPLEWTERPLTDTPDTEHDAPLSSEKIEETFHALLGQAAQRIRVVVLLDALNQFDGSGRTRYLTWLPRIWPAQARLIATAIPGVETEALTRDGRRVEIRSVPPLDREEAGAIAEKVFRERYHRKPNAAALTVLLDRRDTTGSVDRPAHGNPLWLELALQESNLLEGDDYARADREFGHLPGAERMQRLLVSEAEKLPPTVSDVYCKLLDRAARHFGVPLTRSVVDLIALGRAGWRESDLRAVVPAVLDDAAQVGWSELAFAGLRRILGSHLVLRGLESRWDFFHTQLREAVLAGDLARPDDRRRLHGCLTNHLQSLPQGDPLRASETMEHIIGWENAGRAAAWLADLQPVKGIDPLSTADLSGSVDILASTIDNRHESAEREHIVHWIGAIPNAASNEKAAVSAARVLLYDLDEALGVTWSLEVPRGALLQALQDNLRRIYDSHPHDSETSRCLSVAYRKLGDFYLRRGRSGDASLALDNYQRCHQTLEKLCRSSPTDHSATRDLAVADEVLGDFYLRRGGSGDVARAFTNYQQCLHRRQELHEAKSTDGATARDLSVSLNKLGDLFQRRGESGDAARALTSYQQSLLIDQLLYDRNRSSIEAARDLSVTLNRLGDFYLQGGQPGYAALALDHYQQSLRLAQRLYESSPHEGRAASDLSVSLNKLGDFYQQRSESGDLARALDSYQQSLLARQRLFQLNPADGEVALALSVAHERLGDFYLRRGEAGDTARALVSYEHSVETRQQLWEANPTDGAAAKHLSVAREKLGDFYFRRREPGDMDRALDNYQLSHDTRQGLLRSNPDDGSAARDLSLAHDRLGNFYLRRGGHGDAEEVFRNYQEALKLRQRLYESNPTDGLTGRDLSVSLSKLGDYYSRRGQPGDATRALDNYQQCRLTLQQLHESNPANGAAARDLAVADERLGGFYLRRGEPGDIAHALESYRRCHHTLKKLLESNPSDGETARRLAMANEKLGDFYLRRGEAGDATQALDNYQQSYHRCRALYAANPTDGAAARLLTVALSKLGDLYLRRGAPGDAALAFENRQQWLLMAERLYESNPADGTAARDLAFSHGKLAQLYLRQKENAQALEHFHACEKLLERLDAANNQDVRGAIDTTRRAIQRLELGVAIESPSAEGDLRILTIVRQVAGDNDLDLRTMDLGEKLRLVAEVLEHLTGVTQSTLPNDQKQSFVAKARQIASQL